MSYDRLSRWKSSKFLLTSLSGSNTEQRNTVSEMQHKASKDTTEERPRLSQGDIIEACRELIFDVKGGIPVFHAIMPMLNTDEMLIEVSHVLDIIIDPKHGDDEIDEDVRNTLALATANGIPVYPNNEIVAPILAKYHRRMLIDGFTAPDGAGKRVHLKLTKSPGKSILEPSFLQDLNPTEMVSPADLLLIRQAIADERQSFSGVRQLLSGLSTAIYELNELLTDSERNENAIQRCLTDHPFLFGPEYVRVIPKHRLGAEFEMDYALERHSGLVDLIEIESSSLQLFNKKGDPSSHLIHAEQQVFDWLDWIEKFSPYARESLPGLLYPTGIVVIGRSSTLSKQTEARLRRRNAILKPRIMILTYDDLLERARHLLCALECRPL